MRILWITSYPIPNIAKELGLVIGFSGGWIYELSRQLSEKETLGIAFPIAAQSNFKEGCINNISYYAVPLNNDSVTFDKAKVPFFEKAIKKFKPDIIHIWGTEYLSSYIAVIASRNARMLGKTVISIQGMVSVIAKHFYGHIDNWSIHIPTLKDFYFKNSIERQRKNFIARGMYEQKSIKMARHIIGRTDWDRACTSQLNSEAKYHFCNETLRNAFYHNKWNINNCERHSLFVSQCQYPIKGFHHVLGALSILVKKWPDTHLYTTGANIMSEHFKDKLFYSRYEVYLRQLIKRHNLNKHITFLGYLSEEKICERFCKTHVFISPSSIENSSNSMGEAMCLGVPTVASDVGGTKNLLEHGKEGFVYQSDAPYMLAYYIEQIFNNDELSEMFSANAREHGLKTHDKEKNLHRLLDIYGEIISCAK